MFYLNFCYSHFFGQICSQNFKFSKLSESWYRGTLLYAYNDFNVYFSKIFVTHVFGANLVPWSGFLQIDWDFVEGYIANAYFDFNVYFFKIFVIHIFWVNLVPKFEVLQINWNLIEVQCYMLITILMFSFSKFCHSYNFGQT